MRQKYYDLTEVSKWILIVSIILFIVTVSTKSYSQEKQTYRIVEIDSFIYSPYRYEFIEYSWTTIDSGYQIIFNGDGWVTLLVNGKPDYIGEYKYDGKYLYLNDREFRVFLGLEEYVYYIEINNSIVKKFYRK